MDVADQKRIEKERKSSTIDSRGWEIRGRNRRKWGICGVESPIEIEIGSGDEKRGDQGVKVWEI
jgi:hypothetical protein